MVITLLDSPTFTLFLLQMNFNKIIIMESDLRRQIARMGFSWFFFVYSPANETRTTFRYIRSSAILGILMIHLFKFIFFTANRKQSILLYILILILYFILYQMVVLCIFFTIRNKDNFQTHNVFSYFRNTDDPFIQNS